MSALTIVLIVFGVLVVLGALAGGIYYYTKDKGGSTDSIGCSLKRSSPPSLATMAEISRMSQNPSTCKIIGGKLFFWQCR